MDNRVRKEIRFLHSSDWHLGVPTYTDRSSGGLPLTLSWIVSAVNEMFEFAAKFRPHIVLLCGDILHRSSPSPTVENALAACVKKFVGLGSKVFFLLGNHEHSAIGENHLEIYRTLDIEGVVVADKIDVYGIDIGGDEIQVAAMPFNAVMGKNPVSVLENLADRIDCRRPSVLTAHIYVEGSLISGTDRLPILDEPRLPTDALRGLPFQYIALGHVHRYQRILDLPAVYSGSIQRWNFAEEGQEKGFVRGSIELGDFRRTKWDFVPITPVNFKTIEFDLRGVSDPTDKILSMLTDDVANAVVRIYYRQYFGDPLPLIRRVRSAVMERGALSCEIHRNPEKIDRKHTDFQSPSGDILSDIERYVRKNRPELVPQMEAILQGVRKLMD